MTRKSRGEMGTVVARGWTMIQAGVPILLAARLLDAGRTSLLAGFRARGLDPTDARRKLLDARPDLQGKSQQQIAAMQSRECKARGPEWLAGLAGVDVENADAVLASIRIAAKPRVKGAAVRREAAKAAAVARAVETLKTMPLWVVATGDMLAEGHMCGATMNSALSDLGVDLTARNRRATATLLRMTEAKMKESGCGMTDAVRSVVRDLAGDMDAAEARKLAMRLYQSRRRASRAAA